MGRGPKPAKSKEAKPSVARKSPKNEGSRIRDLEKRLAEALRSQAEAQDQHTATSEILESSAVHHPMSTRVRNDRRERGSSLRCH